MNSRRFNGTSDFGVNTSSVDIAAYPLTLSCWVYYLVTSGGFILGFGNSASVGNYIYLFLDGGTPSAGVILNNNVTFTAPTLGGMQANAWNHVAARLQSATSRFVFVNGVKSAENTTSVTFPSVNRTSIGALIEAGTAQEFTAATLFEPCVFNVALSDALILELARGAMPANLQPTPAISLRHLYPFTNPTNVGPDPDLGLGNRPMTWTGSIFVPGGPMVRPSSGSGSLTGVGL